MALTLLSSRQIPGERKMLKLYQGTDPAANAEFTETVPNGVHWQLLAVFATLVTDANAATRLAKITVDDGGANIYAHAQCAAAGQAASLTRQYSWGGEMPAQDTDTSRICPLPASVMIPPGSRVASVTTARQVTDNWGAPLFLVIESY